MNTTNPLSYLSEFLSEYPLYLKFGTDQPLEAEDLNNLEFDFFCRNENSTRVFRLEPTSYEMVRRFRSIDNAEPSPPVKEPSADFTEMFTGICQSCQGYKIKIIVNAGTQNEKPKYFIRKIGQSPAPRATELKLPAEIRYFLDEQGRELYGKAMKNLDAGHGAGALAYLRKIIETEMENIIGMLAGSNSFDTRFFHDAIQAYLKDRHRAKFIEDIRAHLPSGLKEHGANILLLLNDALSVNINELNEEECLKKSKDIDTLFRYMARKINGKQTTI